MKYHIDSHAWEPILSFLKTMKGLHTDKEEALRRFIEAVWYVARSGSMVIGVRFTAVLNGGLMQKFGKD